MLTQIFSRIETDLARETLEVLFGDIEVRIEILHIVEVFENVRQAQHLLRILPLKLHRRRRFHRQLRRRRLKSSSAERFLDRVELRRRGHDFAALLALDHVIRTGLERCFEHCVRIEPVPRFKEQHALLFEEIRHAA